MRSLKRLLLLILMIVLATGCEFREEIGVGIGEDKSVELSVTVKYDEEFVDALLSFSCEEEEDCVSTYTEEEKWEILEDNSGSMDEDEVNLEDYGFTKTKYQDDEYMGFTYTKKLQDIDMITGDEASFNITNDFANFSTSKLFVKEGNTYISKIYIDSDDYTSSEYSDYGLTTSFLLTVTLPNKSISNNATTVSEDGKTLTWNFAEMEGTNIDFEFKFGKSITDYLENSFILIEITIIVILIMAIIIVSKNKKQGGNMTGSRISESGVATPVQSVKSENVEIFSAESIVPAEPAMESVPQKEAPEITSNSIPDVNSVFGMKK